MDLAALARDIPPPWVIRAELARRSLAEFFRQSWHVLEATTPLLWNWHMEAICLHVQVALEDWERRKHDSSYVQRIKDLIINVPPGSAKSRILSVCAPAWMWLRCPSWRVICLSGNPRVATRDSLYCRTLIESEWYQRTFKPTWKLAPDQDTKLLFKNTDGGFRQASTMTSKISGDRADALFPDDPNDAEEVNSEAHRNEVNERWNLAIANRVNDPQSSLRIAIMQRLHAEDWTGHVLATGTWTHLVIRQEYEPELDDVAHSPIGWRDPRREPGELLHPERFSAEVLAEEKKRLGSYGYAGQHQQRPAPKGGGMFRTKWWRFWKHGGVSASGARPVGCRDEPARALPERFREVVISVDANFGGGEITKGKKRSYVVIQVWGAHGADRYLLAQRRGQWDFTETVVQFKAMCADFPRVARKLIENKANGPAIISHLEREISGLVPVEPEGGKEVRAARMTPEVEAGNVFLPEGAGWLESFVDEFSTFPAGSADDQVDCASQALLHLMETSAGVFLAQARL